MKKILKNNARTAAYLEKLPKVHVVACWVRFGVLSFHYAGKCNKEGIPYVYAYYDHNGEADQYELRLLTSTTTGSIYAWSYSRTLAERLADAMNGKRKQEKTS